MTRPQWGFIWMVAWPDLRARARRFLVLGVGMALVLAVTLLLSAFSEGFNLRGERLLGVFDADEFVVAAGSAGPMTSTSPFQGDVAAALAAQPGVEQATPLFLAPNAVFVDGQPVSVVMVATPDDVGWPRIVEGRGLEGPGDAVADMAVFKLGMGDTFVVGGAEFTVVGRTEFADWDVATAGIFIDATHARELFASGADVVTAVAVSGTVDSVPDGLEVKSRADAVNDVVSRTRTTKRSIDSFKLTLWVLALVIVGSVLYLSALERVRDFAIFKATGASNIDLVLGLALQALIMGAVAGVFSIGLARLMMPVYPGLLSLPFSVAWPVVPIAMLIAVVSSFVGVRRATGVDPSQAFG